MAEEPTDGSGSADDTAADAKRKFREALDRKNANAGSGSRHEDGGRKQGSLSTGPAESRREFRRKSV